MIATISSSDSPSSGFFTETHLVAAPSREAVMAQAGSENFPVASYLLGRRYRAHLLAIYGFARLVDDLGDEAAGDRLALLDWLEGELERIYAGGDPEHPLMRSLAGSIAACTLPEEPFRRLIEANRRDQVVTRYESFEELLGYCRLSANPVGELVLHVFGAASPERVALSDRVCSALQVIEHLQDVAEDYGRGRIYLPRQDMAQFGCSERDLAAPSASEGLRALAAFEAQRSLALLAEGAPLARQLPPRPRLAVAGFLAGGRAAVGALARGGYDVLVTPPRAGRSAFITRFFKAVAGR